MMEKNIYKMTKHMQSRFRKIWKSDKAGDALVSTSFRGLSHEISDTFFNLYNIKVSLKYQYGIEKRILIR
jgi:hypothetical protein